jgi:type III secretion protein Q
VARAVKFPPDMPLPFELPLLSRAFAELAPEACAAGAEAAAAAARSLSTLLALDVRIEGTAVPAAPCPRGAALVAIELPALPSQAALEVEPALVVRLVDLLAGGAGECEGATALTPIEAAALELLVLAALDGACSVGAVEAALSPRLARGAAPRVASPLAVELRVSAGDVSGRARLLLPLAAVRALRGEPPADGPGRAIPVVASLRSGTAPLLPGELDALAPGDVVVVEPAAGGAEDLVLPGGLTARGRREEDGTFRVEEVAMADRHAQLPVTLEVELARFEIPLAELARLEPGAAIPLPVDRRGLVTLRCGERAVARGELVELDGAIGVRILSLEVAP